MKCCKLCGEIKALDKFNLEVRRRDGRTQICKECKNAIARKKRIEIPDAFEGFLRSLKNKYKMTIEQFDEMMLNQGGTCAICDKEAFLVIDHDHTTGKVRQLLCRCCNWAVGHLKDSSETAIKASEYLKKHKSL